MRKASGRKKTSEDGRVCSSSLRKPSSRSRRLFRFVQKTRPPPEAVGSAELACGSGEPSSPVQPTVAERRRAGCAVSPGHASKCGFPDWRRGPASHRPVQGDSHRRTGSWGCSVSRRRTRVVSKSRSTRARQHERSYRNVRFSISPPRSPLRISQPFLLAVLAAAARSAKMM